MPPTPGTPANMPTRMGSASGWIGPASCTTRGPRHAPLPGRTAAGPTVLGRSVGCRGGCVHGRPKLQPLRPTAPRCRPPGRWPGGRSIDRSRPPLQQPGPTPAANAPYNKAVHRGAEWRSARCTGDGVAADGSRHAPGPGLGPAPPEPEAVAVLSRRLGMEPAHQLLGQTRLGPPRAPWPAWALGRCAALGPKAYRL